MSVLAVALITCAVFLIIGAEWPRLTTHLRGGRVQPGRRGFRRRARPQLHVVPLEEDDFAESVRRDLDRLPVIEERDDRIR